MSMLSTSKEIFFSFLARNPSRTDDARKKILRLHPCVRVSARLQFSRRSFSERRRNYRRGRAGRRRASLLLLRHVSPRRHFPLPANWTITLAARTSGARSLARNTYFLAHFPYLGNPSSHYVPSPLIPSLSLFLSLFFSVFYILYYILYILYILYIIYYIIIYIYIIPLMYLFVSQSAAQLLKQPIPTESSLLSSIEVCRSRRRLP